MSVRLTPRTDTSPRDRAEEGVSAKSRKGAGYSEEPLEGQSQVPRDAATESKKEAQGGDMRPAAQSGQTSTPPDIGLYLQGTEGKLGLNDTHLYHAQLTSGVVRAVHLRGIQSVEVDDDGEITVLREYHTSGPMPAACSSHSHPPLACIRSFPTRPFL